MNNYCHLSPEEGALIMIELHTESEFRETTSYIVNCLERQLNELLPIGIIEHIGSTSVHGAVTKGDVDIQVAVEAEDFDSSKQILDRHFTHNPEMQPTSTFVSYSGKLESTEFGIQLICTGESEFKFVELREKLKNSPDLLKKYNSIKKANSSGNIDEYRKAKSDFIEYVLKVT